jgi:4-amino-4-deoxy-L-arabinose transferase-like glycosyltransferase
LSSATPINREHAAAAGVRHYALLFAACVLFHVLDTWSLPLVDRDEPRFVEASREMIARGDYIVPHFNNQYRFDKPPLAYWAQVASFRIFGENDFAARFPSIIAAALTALSIFAWGFRIGGTRVAWWAAIIFTLSLQVFLHAKAAVADMWLVLFVTTAHWAGYELISNQRTPNAEHATPNAESKWWWMFYVSLALGFLAKGPIGLIPLLTVVATQLQDRQVDSRKRLAFARGLLLTLVVISIWAIPAYLQTNGQFWRVGVGRHVIARSFGAMEGHGGSSLLVYFLLIPFYFITVFVSFFPWSIKLPWLAKRVWPSRDKIDNYLLAGSAIVFLVFTLIATKLPHYTLPAFPLLSLLLARQLVTTEFPLRRFKVISIATAAVWICAALLVPPLIAPAFPAKALFNASRSDLRPEMEFGAVDYNEPSLVWYFRSRVRGWMNYLDGDSAKSFMEKAGPRFVIIPTSLVADSFPNLPSTWKTFSARGFNIAKGKHVDLTLVLKPE